MLLIPFNSTQLPVVEDMSVKIFSILIIVLIIFVTLTPYAYHDDYRNGNEPKDNIVKKAVMPKCLRGFVRRHGKCARLLRQR